MVLAGPALDNEQNVGLLEMSVHTLHEKIGTKSMFCQEFLLEDFKDLKRKYGDRFRNWGLEEFLELKDSRIQMSDQYKRLAEMKKAQERANDAAEKNKKPRRR